MNDFEVTNNSPVISFFLTTKPPTFISFAVSRNYKMIFFTALLYFFSAKAMVTNHLQKGTLRRTNSQQNSASSNRPRGFVFYYSNKSIAFIRTLTWVARGNSILTH